jgi:hypothetical protein
MRKIFLGAGRLASAWRRLRFVGNFAKNIIGCGFSVSIANPELH